MTGAARRMVYNSHCTMYVQYVYVRMCMCVCRRHSASLAAGGGDRHTHTHTHRRTGTSYRSPLPCVSLSVCVSVRLCVCVREWCALIELGVMVARWCWSPRVACTAAQGARRVTASMTVRCTAASHGLSSPDAVPCSPQHSRLLLPHRNVNPYSLSLSVSLSLWLS